MADISDDLRRQLTEAASYLRKSTNEKNAAKAQPKSSKKSKEEKEQEKKAREFIKDFMKANGKMNMQIGDTYFTLNNSASDMKLTHNDRVRIFEDWHYGGPDGRGVRTQGKDWRDMTPAQHANAYVDFMARFIANRGKDTSKLEISTEPSQHQKVAEMMAHFASTGI